jgi:hypothetical protein
MLAEALLCDTMTVVSGEYVMTVELSTMVKVMVAHTLAIDNKGGVSWM